MAKLGIQIWQFDQDYGQGNIPDNDAEIPLSVAVVKTNWSTNWMRTVDAAPSAESLDGVRRLAGIYRDQGIDFVPWGEAHGGAKAYDEGYMMGQIAAACGHGVYMLDLEGDRAHYWNAAPGAVQEFMRGFRDGGGRELWVEPDARRGHEAAIQLDDWIADPTVTRWYPQTYWQDFYPNHASENRVLWGIEDATTNLRKRGVLNSRIFPVFNGDARSTAGEWQFGFEMLRQEGYGGVMVWRRGTLSRPVMDYIAGLPDDQMPGYVPPPLPPVTEPDPDFLTPIRAAREFAQATVVTLDAVIAANTGK